MLSSTSQTPDPVELEHACHELIICTRQPGRLRISRRACALRHLQAHKKNFFPEDEFGVARKVGLDICRGCPQGRFYASGEEQALPLDPQGRRPRTGWRSGP